MDNKNLRLYEDVVVALLALAWLIWQGSLEGVDVESIAERAAGKARADLAVQNYELEKEISLDIQKTIKESEDRSWKKIASLGKQLPTMAQFKSELNSLDFSSAESSYKFCLESVEE